MLAAFLDGLGEAGYVDGMALLANPSNPAVAEIATSQMLTAARTLGLELQVVSTRTENDLDAAFAKLDLRI